MFDLFVAYLNLLADLFPLFVVGGALYLAAVLLREKAFRYFNEADKTLAAETSAWPTETTPTFLDN